MLAVTLTLGTLISIMFFFIGGVMGWMLKQYVFEKNYLSSTHMHPEMFDENGNVIPDEILAVRFENDYDDDNEEEDDD
ncbi:MAG: DUF2973 domain-containing protein [Alphaproteobacteria bacterium]|jgi:hypothetical protein|nr:DUF2973 domain-containing protein [Alphaproteobacteria bacterium]